MEANNYSRNFTVNLSAAEIMQKISNVPGWWGVSFTGSASNKDDNFVIEMGGDSFFNCTVSELVPAKKIAWLVADCNMPWYKDKKEWAGTKMVFDLDEHDGSTHVMFTHEGLTPDSECYVDCEPGWTHWIQTSLVSYLTTGNGVFRKSTK
ncbi:SRPBCC domain-containing protein [Danxiaibacter flavus]|uniref:SRPBCC domain-containing protein n=1 Tax=Danxiaibacter flavus TaxID=3049108 RepID=A0ABV3ZJG3_9BACT|nr:SRPBCC domain-containing protein [Chitinophagaceae bacterium DXS]